MSGEPTIAQPLVDVVGRSQQAFFYEIPDGAFVDPNGDALQFSVTLANGAPLPDWLSFDAKNGRLAGLAPEGAAPLQIAVTATDPSGGAVTDVFEVTFEAARVFDARDYGAVAGDSIDDTGAIQSAINAAFAAGGGTVTLGPGVYIVSGTDDKSDGALRLLENVTLKGAGQDLTTLKVADGFNQDITGVIRTPFNEVTNNVGLFGLTIDGNRAGNPTGKIDGFYTGVAPGDPRAMENVIVQDVRIANCSGYGFDPHEITVGMFVIDNVANNNGLDGFVADYIVEGLYRGNVAYDNDRHGFNVTTTSQSLTLENNVAASNTATGITIQRGSENIPNPRDIDIVGGRVFGNAQEGIIVRLADDISISGVLIEENGRAGIRIRGATDVDIYDNTIRDNSLAGSFDQVVIENLQDTTTGNLFLTLDVDIVGNSIIASGVAPRSGIAVTSVPASELLVTDNRIAGNVTPTRGFTADATNDTSAAGLAPVVNGALAATSLAQGQPLSFALPAGLFTDPEGQALTLSARLADGRPLPDWLSFNAQTGVFSGTPDNSDIGSFAIEVVAVDPVGLATEVGFTISVSNVDDAPVVINPLPDAVAQAGFSLELAIPADTFFDADIGDQLTLTVTLADGAPLPSWMTYNSATGLLTGTPPAGVQSAYDIRVTARDIDGATAFDEFTLNIGNDNRAPVLETALPDASGRANQAFFFSVPKGFITDADGDRLKFTASLADGSPLPDWMILNPLNGSISGLPPTTGRFDVQITATDAAGQSVSDVVSFNIRPERVYYVSDYAFTDAQGRRNGDANDGLADNTAIQRAIDDAARKGGGTIVLGAGTFDVTGLTEPSDGAITLRSNTTLIGAGMGETIIKVQDGWNGNITGIVRSQTDRVTDNIGLFDLTLDGNRANTTGKIDGFFIGVAPGDPRFGTNSITQRVEIRNNEGYGFDPHERTNNLFAVDIISHGNGLDGFVADFITEGLYKNNLAYNNDRHGFNIVTQSNELLLLDNHAWDNGSTGITIQRGTAVQPLSNNIFVEGGTLIGNGREGIVIKLVRDITISNVLIEENGYNGIRTYGAEDVLIRDNLIRNNSQAAAGVYDQVQVSDQNDTSSGLLFPSFRVSIIDNLIVADGEILPRYAVREDADGSNFTVVDGNRMIGFFRAVSLAGLNSIATQNDTSANAAPVPVTGLQGVNARQGSPFTLTLPSTLFTDPTGETLTLALRQTSGAPLPSWLKFDLVTRTLSGTPDADDLGQLSLWVTATDPNGLSARILLPVSVVPPGNAAPVVNNATPDITAAANVPFSIDFRASQTFRDADNDPLTLTARLSNGQPLPAWLSFNQTTGVLSGTPTDTQTLSIDIIARDPSGAVATDVFVLTIGLPQGTAGNDLLIGTAGDDPLNGLGGVDELRGLGGADILDGGLDADLMIGGAGNDTYYVDNAGDVTREIANDGYDIVFASVNYTLADHLEELRLTGGASTGTGNSLNNIILGNALANILDGGAGIDQMTGGDGDDTYVVDNAADVVVEVAGQGVDTVNTSVNWTLGAAFENGAILGAIGRTLTGNTLGNALIGGAGNDTLNGLAGADFLDGGVGADALNGGDGNDTYRVDNAGDVVTEFVNNGAGGYDVVESFINYTLTTNVEEGRLLGSALMLTGNNAANTLVGNALANVIDGGTGNDIMRGGLGDDVYVFNTTSDQAIENAGEGFDTIRTTVSITLAANVEGGLALGSSAINLTGNALDNTLTGNAAANRLIGGVGADILNGQAGADTMEGGDGADTYFVDNIGDRTTEATSGAVGGVDTVFSSIDHTLATNVENLVLTGAAVRGTGNGSANQITGNALDNILDGGLGDDFLIGGLGNDTYFINTTKDVVTEAAGEGIDTVTSSVSLSSLFANVENATLTGTATRLTGNTLDNRLIGNASNNEINGGLGADVMTGGLGSDRFVMEFGQTNGDVITDFEGAGLSGGDTLDIRGIGQLTAAPTQIGDVWTFQGTLGSMSFTLTGVTALIASDYLVS